MTEEEAKKKWCPFAKPDLYQSRAGMSRNVNSEPLKGTSCIGSTCMAWRWADPWTSQTEEGHGGDLVLRLKRTPGEPKLGFCGLAGHP